MTVRPIIFSGPMVRALLDGRKTQTRRVLRPQPKHVADTYQRVMEDEERAHLQRLLAKYGAP